MPIAPGTKIGPYEIQAPLGEGGMGKSFLTSLVVLSALVVPTPTAAQELLTDDEIVAMASPPPDARIAYGDESLQFGYLRLPEGRGPHPTIIFIHGGCWLSAYDIQHTGPAEQALADAGYAVWSIEYRRVGDEGSTWPGLFLDIGLGVDHLYELAGEYPLDLDRVIAAGHSAGGALALWAAARSRIPASSELHVARPLPIHGVLALTPAPTLEALHSAGVCGDVVNSFMGGAPEDYPERYDSASPMRLTPVGVPQRIIVGAYDQAWGPSGRAYFEHASAEGRSAVTLREASESGHFEVIVPTTTSWALVLDELRSLSADIEPARQ